MLFCDLCVVIVAFVQKSIILIIVIKIIIHLAESYWGIHLYTNVKT